MKVLPEYYLGFYDSKQIGLFYKTPNCRFWHWYINTIFFAVSH